MSAKPPSRLSARMVAALAMVANGAAPGAAADAAGVSVDGLYKAMRREGISGKGGRRCGECGRLMPASGDEVTAH